MLAGESVHGETHSVPTVVVAEERPAGRECLPEIREIIGDILFLVAPVEVDQIRADAERAKP